MIRRPGGFQRLRLQQAPDATPGPGQVLVETRASGVNFADCVVRMGYYASAKQYVGWPITPGFEFAGHVGALGPGVTDPAPGTPVFGVARFGAYATQVVVPRQQIFTMPERATMEEAATFPVIYLTAYYALHQVIRIRPGATVLIHSAAGGVGSALVQLCRRAGWRSIAVVGSTHKVEPARAMGADVVIDRSRTSLWAEVERHAPEGVDVVLDSYGAATLRAGFRHLRPTGTMISYGFHSMFRRGRGTASRLKLLVDYLRTPSFNPVGIHTQNRNLVSFNLSFLFDRLDLLDESMTALHRWWSAGEIRLPPITTYPLAEAARAHRDLQSGTTVGKLALVVP